MTHFDRLVWAWQRKGLGGWMVWVGGGEKKGGGGQEAGVKLSPTGLYACAHCCCQSTLFFCHTKTHTVHNLQKQGVNSIYKHFPTDFFFLFISSAAVACSQT